MDYHAHYNDALGKFAICDQGGTIIKNVPQGNDVKIGFCQKTEIRFTNANFAYYRDIKNIQIDKALNGSQMIFFESEKSTYCVWDNEKSAKIESIKSKDVTQFKKDCKFGIIKGEQRSINIPAPVEAISATSKARGDAIDIAKNAWNVYKQMVPKSAKMKRITKYFKNQNTSEFFRNENLESFLDDKNKRVVYFEGILKNQEVAKDPYVKAVVEQLQNGLTKFNAKSEQLKQAIKNNIKNANIPTVFNSVPKPQQRNAEQTGFSSLNSIFYLTSVERNRSPSRACTYRSVSRNIGNIDRRYDYDLGCK